MPGDCPVETGQCLAWAHKYLLDCICSIRDELSLTLGLLSVVSWGVAEVPQIITNFKVRNAEGVSLAFLITWVVGDVFNLGGCWLEPATLPTQFYMALLYTLTTMILVFQTVYYGYLLPYFRPPEPLIEGTAKDEAQKPTQLPDVEGQTIPCPVKRSSSATQELSSSVISVPHSRRPSRDFYYTSARSLASSHTPTVGSILVGSRESGGQTQSILRSEGSGSAATAAQEYLIPDDGAATNSHEADSSPSRTSTGRGGGGSPLTRTAQAAAGSILLVGSVGLSCNYLSGGSFGLSANRMGGGGALLRTGRSLLMMHSSGSSPGAHFVPNYFREVEAAGPWGEVFGWCMAAIYMGGRLPQILLNMKRGTVEGLNPLMFIFALVGNASYVSSILVRTVEWKLIKPNMPWLVDAGVCIVLDIFIICQFVYYASRGAKALRSPSEQEDEEKKGNYHLINKEP